MKYNNLYEYEVLADTVQLFLCTTSNCYQNLLKYPTLLFAGKFTFDTSETPAPPTFTCLKSRKRCEICSKLTVKSSERRH